MKTSWHRIAVMGWAALAAVAAVPAAHAGKTLDGIKARGQVVCGVNTGLAGFAMADASGKWSGLDVDVCRALAAAVLGDGHNVKYVPVDVPQRFTALQSGEVDVLSRNTTFSLTRDASLGLHQTVVTYYDGQGFIVPAKSKIKSTRQLKGQTVCVQSGTTTEKNLLDYSRTNGLDVKPVMFEKIDAATSAYLAGRCTAYTTDASGLASLRSTIRDGAATHAILPELISKEPLGPLVRRGDDEWFAVVKWVIYGLIEAEEYGVTQANAEQLKTSSTHPVVQRMLGTSEDTGKLLGLDRDWLLRAVKTTGNYGEIFERNVGPKSALGLPRGLNNQWNKQGLMYAVPIR
ncbi:amino acid ABC transporter substrate-binding protein [Acidovorax sp. Leaf76]|uniref:amino acid ABC transporter substrate-binding protein n=1 Tax=unclassified Acidovorax TaxID=2684926 RepID=UPI0006FEF7A3|nr:MULTISPECIES: amino acid ABC transporter substrate-binding protein [unclassified Acidovorax]KQO24370.1 amino acid ABC transporter substrate-binding protein [Acidovorax sp. Leaf76]KQS24562.1 amino acid ABC transporter substrate-binding protein [Acidovorax sp. Leaf191]